MEEANPFRTSLKSNILQGWMQSLHIKASESNRTLTLRMSSLTDRLHSHYPAQEGKVFLFHLLFSIILGLLTCIWFLVTVLFFFFLSYHCFSEFGHTHAAVKLTVFSWASSSWVWMWCWPWRTSYVTNRTCLWCMSGSYLVDHSCPCCLTRPSEWCYVGLCKLAMLLATNLVAVVLIFLHPWCFAACVERHGCQK